ncbi:hypothetical protein XSR1_10192 [Xenorhabdus szentirmaii DSM 16338]|uniref:Uncharacterized protein n=1 Tax=Xenorhabdus szentirmaii DSM 16338 TaxID=1427518 RepID=W1ISX0_9GAMM|nr:hypothetical protein XSR1_10192 [Xenorhabdus szentirmaii DSM 16338]
MKRFIKRRNDQWIHYDLTSLSCYRVGHIIPNGFQDALTELKLERQWVYIA